MKNKILSYILAITTTVSCFSQVTFLYADTNIKLDSKNPVLLNVWNYYSGMQKQIFDSLVQEFNETIGLEEGIIIESYSKGSVGELTDALNASFNHEVGADEIPDMFSAYSDTAYEINKEGMLADLSPYLTEEELSMYMDSYIQEGYLDQTNTFKLFPIAKSTEILLLNKTDWDTFASETGSSEEKLSTWEGIAELAEAYYNWTDAQTPDTPNDGKAFFGRDAFANYMLIGSLQLGKEIFKTDGTQLELQVDKDIMHKLWDCYYVPYVNGWFGSYGSFRSDDIKTGLLLAEVGSTSGAMYFPSEVTHDDGTTYSIESATYPLPNFEGSEPYAVQQGAGMVVTKSTPEKEYAATLFLKWFTEPQNNIDFSLGSGYFPVEKEANNSELLSENMNEKDVSDLLRSIILVGEDTINNSTLYTCKSFENGYAARKILDNYMPDAANAACKKRDALISEGASREEAIAQLTNEDAFENWFTDFETALRDTIQQ